MGSFPGLKHSSNVPVSYLGWELWINDQSCQLLSFLLALPKYVILLPWALFTSPILIKFWTSSVSVITSFLQEWVIDHQPTPQPGGPGDHTSSGLYPSTCSAWVTLPGEQDSSRHSSRGYGDMQSAPPR